MKNLKDIHVVEGGDADLVYHRSTYDVLRVGHDLGRILQRLQKKESLGEIAEDLDLDLEELERSIAAVDQKLQSLPNHVRDVKELKDPTMYLHVSNACNLACVYCYANGGSYNSAPGVMSLETAIESVDRFFETFGRLGVVNFFGGEPLLQSKLILPVCDYILKKSKVSGVEPPQFSIVTNGTMLTEENVSILAKYGFSATVSIDGPEEINDLLRPTVGGRGSFAKISEGLGRLRNAGIRPNIEATFTGKHFALGLEPKGLLEFFRINFQTRTITIAPVASTPGEEVSLSEYYDRMIPAYCDAARYSLKSLESDEPILLYQVNHVLNYLLTKTRKPENQFCYTHLGEEHFTVSSEGKIYPCQMMNDQPKYEMGTIQDEKFAEREQYKKVQSQFKEMEKGEMQCRTCWARDLCFMCVAGVEIETGALKPIPKHRCDLIKGVIEEVLRFVADASRDQKRWDLVCKNLFG